MCLLLTSGHFVVQIREMPRTVVMATSLSALPARLLMITSTVSSRLNVISWLDCKEQLLVAVLPMANRRQMVVERGSSLLLWRHLEPVRHQSLWWCWCIPTDLCSRIILCFVPFCSWASHGFIHICTNGCMHVPLNFSTNKQTWLII